MTWNLELRSLCLGAAVACVSPTLGAQTRADSTVLARLVAAAATREVPVHTSDSVVFALPRTPWDSAVVRELRSLRRWPPPADTVVALHIGPTALWLEGNRAIVTVRSSRCQLEVRSRLNWWRQDQDYEFRRVGMPEESRWEAVVGRGTVTVADGDCTRSARPESGALESGTAPPAG